MQTKMFVLQLYSYSNTMKYAVLGTVKQHSTVVRGQVLIKAMFFGHLVLSGEFDEVVDIVF